MRFPFTTTIERDEWEYELAVVYDVTPYRPATGPTYACGGQPAEGGEVELISVKHNGAEFTLTAAEAAALIAECEERAGEDMADEEAAAADWKYQEARDRQLMRDWEN